MCHHCESRREFLQKAGAEMAKAMEAQENVDELFHSLGAIGEDGTPHPECVEGHTMEELHEISKAIHAFEKSLKTVAGFMAVHYGRVNHETASATMLKWAADMAESELRQSGIFIVNLDELFNGDEG